jgi:hypothetical protein
MRNDQLDIVIRVLSGESKFQFGAAEIEAMRTRYSPALHITISPDPRREDKEKTSANAREFLTLYIFVYAGLAFVVAKLLEGVLKEAGADIYKGVKRRLEGTKSPEATADIVNLLSSLLARNDADSYGLYQTVFIGCTLNKQYAVVRLSMSSDDFRGDEEYEASQKRFYEQLDKLDPDRTHPAIIEKLRSELARELEPLCSEWLHEELRSLSRDWEKILADIDRFKIGAESIGWSHTGFHVIAKRANDDGAHCWTISALDPVGSVTAPLAAATRQAHRLRRSHRRAPL